MVARGNQWYQGTNNDGLLKFCDYHPHKMGITPQNMPQTL